MIIELHPPRSVGPLELAATGHEIVATMRHFGGPEVLCRAAGDRAGWCVMHPSGLFLSAYFDADDRAEAIELGRPTDPGVTVTYGGLDIFRTPATDLVEALRRTTRVLEEENGHSYTAPDLLLALWRPTTPEGRDDAEGNYFESVLIAEPGYYDKAQPTAG
ncbi:hypothetical protein AB0L64_27280 [Kribbella sp. NPDC051936]|uniref:hypothetical protein n=1 Tax=Kribbella sp. NPDC051936 TaxID=3154946 RepID=UPI0034241A0F